MILATVSQILGSKTKVEAGDLRIEMSGLLYAWISGGFGLVLNMSEGGMAIQTMVPLNVGQMLKFGLPLSKVGAEPAGVELTGTAEVAWCDCSGRAGLHFTDVSEGEQLQLRSWLEHDEDHDYPRVLCQEALQDLGNSRSSALLNAEVNCFQFFADRDATTAR